MCKTSLLAGTSLAIAEINLVLACLFRPSGPVLELFETDESDVIQAHDFLLPLPRLDTKGIRVMIHWAILVQNYIM